MKQQTDSPRDILDPEMKQPAHLSRLLLNFMIVTIVGPFASAWGIFSVLIAIDPVALPWFSFLLVPFVWFVVLLPIAISLGRQIYYQAGNTEEGGALIQALIQISILWVPVVNAIIFVLLKQNLFPH